MTYPSVSATVVGSGTAVSSFSLASWTPSANDLVLVFVAIRQTTVSVSSISGNGITFSLVTAISGTQGQERTELWRGQVASPSTGQITVTLSGSPASVVGMAHRITGAKFGSNGSDAIDASATADTGATDTDTPSVNITTTGAERLVIGSASTRNRTFSVGSGETAISLNNTGGAGGDQTTLSTEYQNVATASTVTINGTMSGVNDWTMIAVAIMPGGASFAFSTTVASLSSTPDVAVLKVARALADTVASQSSTPTASVLAVARALADTIASLSSTPNVVSLLRAIPLADSVASLSSTPDVVSLEVVFLRALSTMVNSLSNTPDVAALKVARGLADSVASLSSTPDVLVLLRAMGLADSVASQSSTPDVVSLLRALPLSTTVASLSSTQDAAAITNLIALLSTVASQSSTPDVAVLAVARALSTTVASQSATGDIDFEPLLAALLDHVFSVLRRRWSFVVGGSRTVAIPAARRSFEAHLMAVAEVPKDPDEIVDYAFDYANLLEGDTIASSVWATDTGDVVVDTDSETTTTTTARISGGTLGTKSKVKNTVTTTSGQVLIRRLVIVVQEM